MLANELYLANTETISRLSEISRLEVIQKQVEQLSLDLSTTVAEVLRESEQKQSHIVKLGCAKGEKRARENNEDESFDKDE